MNLPSLETLTRETLMDTETAIEAWFEHAQDRLDARYTSGRMTKAEYEAACNRIARHIDCLYFNL